MNNTCSMMREIFTLVFYIILIALKKTFKKIYRDVSTIMIISVYQHFDI